MATSKKEQEVNKPVAKKTTSGTTRTALKVPRKKLEQQSTGTLPTGPMLSLPEGVSQELEPQRLLLDPQNLRLLERTSGAFESLEPKLFGQNAIQKKLFDIILGDERFDITSLAESIANNGFLKHERLIVAKYDGEKYLVLEGNRRVTAVRYLLAKYGSEFQGLRSDVRESLQTLPCFVLKGPVIDGQLDRLKTYRRGAEIYIGMRHLMGAKSWEPASRYEFQSRLIFEENWSVNDIAARFGREKRDVVRDLQAHVLYQEFVKFEKRVGVQHSLTYNSFSEAARAPAILKWLKWDAKEQRFSDEKNEEIFFRYLVARLGKSASAADVENYDEIDLPVMSAETAVRRLRDILKLEDPVVEEALQEFDFNSAEILFEERKEGALPKKILNFIRILKRAPSDELSASPEVAEKLKELQSQIERSLKVIAALSGN